WGGAAALRFRCRVRAHDGQHLEQAAEADAGDRGRGRRPVRDRPCRAPAAAREAAGTRTATGGAAPATGKTRRGATCRERASAGAEAARGRAAASPGRRTASARKAGNRAQGPGRGGSSTQGRGGTETRRRDRTQAEGRSRTPQSC